MMWGEGNDYEMGWEHVKKFQVRMDNIPGQVDFHMIQMMDIPWLDFCAAESTSVW